jgi:hypothetical protein
VTKISYYKHLFPAGEHLQSRISIHRCYKGYRGGAMGVPGAGDSRGSGAGLCRILDMNFREYLFHALR